MLVFNYSVLLIAEPGQRFMCMNLCTLRGKVASGINKAIDINFDLNIIMCPIFWYFNVQTLDIIQFPEGTVRSSILMHILLPLYTTAAAAIRL